MTALPASADFTGSGVTEAQFKTAITGLRDYLSGLLGTDGAVATALVTLGAFGSATSAKSGAYTVVAADRGKVFFCTGTFTLTLTAAATLADGFAFSVVNVGSGTITVDPAGSEQIDGATTITFPAGSSGIVSCNGTSFRSIGKIATGSGSGLDADLLDGHDSSYFSASTHNHTGVYSPMTAFVAGTHYACTISSGCSDRIVFTKADGGTVTVTFSGTPCCGG